MPDAVPTHYEIHDHRHALGLTQAEFAARLRVSLHTLRSWEQGRREPHGLYLAALVREMHRP